MKPRKQLVYLIGAPGSGKSTLMRELTQEWTRTPAEMGLTRDFLLSPSTCSLEAVELGRRRRTFAGTDALGQSVIREAIIWMITQTETELVFAEGARLGCARFLTASVAAGYAVTLGYLEHDQVEEWRRAREARLGRVQNPSWVAGRATAARNLALWGLPDGVSLISGHPDTLRWEIPARIAALRSWG